LRRKASCPSLQAANTAPHATVCKRPVERMHTRFFGQPVVWLRWLFADETLKAEFDRWMRSANVHPAIHGGKHGGGNGYSPADARKVIAWLREHGAEMDPGVMS
jgi:hypothetical protein